MEPQRTPCPCCGAYSLTQDDSAAALLAVCDVLVIKALEHMGKWTVRRERSRFPQRGSQPWHLVHTVWPVNDETVDKVIYSAWDVVPALLQTHGCANVTPIEVTSMLDSYVHDLVITGTPHTIEELAYRFRSHLNLPVWLKESADA